MCRVRAVSFATLLSVGCGSATSPSGWATPTPSTPVKAAQSYADSLNAFGFELWKQQPKDGNAALSFASVATALTMAYGGAAGDTAAEMAGVLHVGLAPDETLRAAGALLASWNDPARTSYQLAVANRLFGDRRVGFRDAYLAATRDQFGAELQRVDFQGDADGARRTINGWVSDRTHARIPELLPVGSVDPSTRMVLIDAVYFKGAWRDAFDPKRTWDQTFHLQTSDVEVPTMHTRGGRFAATDGVKLLELPYAGGDLAMTLVLPDDPKGLAAVEERLDPATVERWQAALADRDDVNVALPRFTLTTGAVSLGAALQRLGMRTAFSAGADFSPMVEPGQASLAIADVVHSVFVAVDEQGTEAAAATGVVIEATSLRPDRPEFIADHPFLFLLRDVHTGAILFTGRVADPRG